MKLECDDVKQTDWLQCPECDEFAIPPTHVNGIKSGPDGQSLAYGFEDGASVTCPGCGCRLRVSCDSESFEIYVEEEVELNAADVGDLVRIDNVLYLVTHKTPALTPYNRAGQDTKADGFTYGLRRL